MKNILYIAATVLLCSSCFHVNSNYKGSFFGGKDAIKGEGPVTSVSFDNLTGFDAIEINGHADVQFNQSSVYEVTVKTQENILEWLDYKVDGTTLIIETKDHREIRAERYDLVIQAPALKKLVVNGASDFEINSLRVDGGFEVNVNGAGDLDFDHITCQSLTVEVNGAADANLTDLYVQEALKVEVNGAGDVNLTGASGTASFEVNGAGDIDATGLKVAGKVSKHASGLAKIKM